MAGCGSASGGGAANTPPPLTVGQPATLIAAQLRAYNQCVESSPWHEFEPENPEVPEAPEGNSGDMGVTPQEGTVPFPSNNDLFISTMKICLSQNPMAALVPGYTGLPPGSLLSVF